MFWINWFFVFTFFIQLLSVTVMSSVRTVGRTWGRDPTGLKSAKTLAWSDILVINFIFTCLPNNVFGLCLGRCFYTCADDNDICGGDCAVKANPFYCLNNTQPGQESIGHLDAICVTDMYGVIKTCHRARLDWCDIRCMTVWPLFMIG